MTRYIALLCFTASIKASPLVDNGLSHPWLPAPDGYAWPQAIEDPPAFEIVEKAFAALPDTQRDAIRRHWPQDTDPESIGLAEIDLNADATPELCGAHPCLQRLWRRVLRDLVFPLEGRPYRSIGGVQGRIGLLPQLNGWMQIEIVSRSSEGRHTRHLMAFGTHGYEDTRTEFHNLNRGDVSVRQHTAENAVVNSDLFADIRSRVADPDNIRIVPESCDPNGYDFWIYEDQTTHVTTLERVRIDRTGELYVRNLISGQWKPWQHNPRGGQ